MKKKKLVCVILISLLVSLVGISAFACWNPYQLYWCDEIQYQLKDSIQSLFEKRSSEQTTGVTDGISLVDVSYQGQVENKEQALAIVESFNQFKEHQFFVTEPTQLANQNWLYAFEQTVEGRPVYGKKQLLILDSAQYAKYFIGDDAALTYTKEQKSIFGEQYYSVEEVFGEDIIVASKKECWYDTGDGLVAAYQVQLQNNENNVIGEVVVDEKENRILELVAMNENDFQTISHLYIQRATKDVLELLSQDAVSEMKKLAEQKITNESDSILRIAKALAMMARKSGLKQEQVEKILRSSMQIAEETTDCNENRYREIVLSQISMTIVNDGKTEKESQKYVDKVNKFFRQSGIEQYDDEVATAIIAQPHEKKFRHEINYIEDSDVFSLGSNTPEADIYIQIATECPVELEIYNEKEQAMVSMYIEEEQQIELAPEDGTNFIVRVKSSELISENAEREFTYDIKTSSEKREPPEYVKSVLTRIEDSYNQSEISTFVSLWSVTEAVIDAMDSEEVNQIVEEILPHSEGLIDGADKLLPGLDKILGDVTGLTEDIDSTKTIIAANIIPPTEQDMEILSMLGESSMQLKYYQHIDIQNGAIVKAKMTISMPEGAVYDGYVYMVLEHLEKKTDERNNTIRAFLASLATEYYITEVNTENLYQKFNDSVDNLNVVREIPSLFDFCGEEQKAYVGYRKTFDENQAIQAGYNEERVERFNEFILNVNIGIAKIKLARVQFEKSILALSIKKEEFMEDALWAGNLIYNLQNWDSYVVEKIAGEDVAEYYDTFKLLALPIKSGFEEGGKEFAKEFILGDIGDKIDDASKEVAVRKKKLEDELDKIKKLEDDIKRVINTYQEK